ncbi:MAG: hypothetical protein BA868_07555 [Desulfobacterales bacterium C00003106]|jgi:organic radical activating enzyme|nr:MAG: hypothetical protein BA868_07555 [Desulfobacterales bacterium C00003106]
MTNEKIIMSKNDYHKILDIVDVLLEYYDDDMSKVEDIKDLLEKADCLDDVILNIIKDMDENNEFIISIKLDTKKNTLLKKAQTHEEDN